MAKMTEFDYDVRDRKQVARMAKYKKNGSKSKHCSLPSDGMTRKQWEKKNGKVEIYNMNKPMSWEEFKSMPIDLQKSYANDLVGRFAVTCKKLAEMFNCIPPTVRKYFNANGFGIEFKQGKIMTKDQLAAWESFVNNSAVVEQPEPVVEEPAAESAEMVEEAVVAQAELVNTTEAEEKKPAKSISTMLKEFSLTFEGKIDPISIGNSIAAIVGSNANGRVEVRYVM